VFIFKDKFSFVQNKFRRVSYFVDIERGTSGPLACLGALIEV
jgi:hypothetical protein